MGFSGVADGYNRVIRVSSRCFLRINVFCCRNKCLALRDGECPWLLAGGNGLYFRVQSLAFTQLPGPQKYVE